MALYRWTVDSLAAVEQARVHFDTREEPGDFLAA